MATLYHGTTAPIESIKKQGLKVYQPKWVRELLISRLSNPDQFTPYLEKAIKIMGKGPIGSYNIPALYLSSTREGALYYQLSPPEELGYNLVEAMPKRLKKELLEALVETRGDLIIG